MLLGITDNLQEKNRVAIKKRMGTVTTAFIAMMVLPFVLYMLFHFNVLSSKSIFSADIQEPVAKVITTRGVGTAFLVSPTTLLTARHVVENYQVGDAVDLIFEHSQNQLQTKARIVFMAPSTVQPVNDAVPIDYFLADVAVLEVSEITDIEPLVLGESDAVQNLDEVILMGYPNGDYSITKGNINSTRYQGLDLFKLDAASNPGNSGGPCILSDDNTVIGILVGRGAATSQGENIAIKMADVRRILSRANIVL